MWVTLPTPNESPKIRDIQHISWFLGVIASRLVMHAAPSKEVVLLCFWWHSTENRIVHVEIKYWHARVTFPTPSQSPKIRDFAEIG